MENWLKDQYVKEWFVGLSDASKDNYTNEFPKWLEFIKMTPTQQIEKRLNDIRSDNPRERAFFERKMIEFKNMLVEKGYSKNTIEKNYLRTVQSFFGRNRLPLKFKRGELTVERTEKVEKVWIPSNEEVRVLYSVADLRDRALLLVLYHSGFSEADVSNMNVEDFDFYNEKGEWTLSEGHLYHKRYREKTDIAHETCISEEALHDIKLMLQARGFPKKGALFVSHKGDRLSVRFIHDALKRVCKKALPEQAKDFETKSLRDAYHDALARAEIKEGIAKRMFGHKPQGAEASYYVSPATIKEAYSKAFKYLTINSGRREREVIEKLTTKLDSIETRNEALQKTIVHLMKELADKGVLSKKALEGALKEINA
jgi:integrase